MPASNEITTLEKRLKTSGKLPKEYRDWASKPGDYVPAFDNLTLFQLDRTYLLSDEFEMGDCDGLVIGEWLDEIHQPVVLKIVDDTFKNAIYLADPAEIPPKLKKIFSSFAQLVLYRPEKPLASAAPV